MASSPASKRSRTSGLTLGVIGSSFKENEKRIPLTPAHLADLPPELRSRIFVEHGYGLNFRVTDEELAASVGILRLDQCDAPQIGGLLTREELFQQCDIILLPKPVSQDFPHFREGQILWGWPVCCSVSLATHLQHFVQGTPITQASIDKKLTWITWEGSFEWSGSGTKGTHTYAANNEMAGYCSVMHCMSCAGMTGAYGPPLKAAVIGFGSVGRGATHALRGLNVADITVYTGRPPHTVANRIPGVKTGQYSRHGKGVHIDGEPAVDALGKFDIICLCVLQDTDNPLMFVKGKEVEKLKKGTVIVDISCDEGMGFDFAKPTSFEKPWFPAGNGRVLYYAVDHSPTHFCEHPVPSRPTPDASASWEISRANMALLPTVMAGRKAWKESAVISNALEVRVGFGETKRAQIVDGVINKDTPTGPKILTFQHRGDQYPHAIGK